MEPRKRGRKGGDCKREEPVDCTPQQKDNPCNAPYCSKVFYHDSLPDGQMGRKIDSKISGLEVTDRLVSGLSISSI
jgi:hypothetical protein